MIRELSSEEQRKLIPISKKFVQIINDENRIVAVGVSPDTWIESKTAWKRLTDLSKPKIEYDEEGCVYPYGRPVEPPSGYPGRYFRVDDHPDIDNRLAAILRCLPDYEAVTKKTSDKTSDGRDKSEIRMGRVGEIDYFKIAKIAVGSAWVADQCQGRKFEEDDSIFFLGNRINFMDLPSPLSIVKDPQEWPFPKVILKKEGWLIKVLVDQENPSFVSALISISLTGGLTGEGSPILCFPIHEWVKKKSDFEKKGIKWIADGFDPDEPWNKKIEIIEDDVPGWSKPAFNGKLLHEYQKEGVRFALSRGSRALIADQMGLGKTAQALAVSVASKSTRTIVVCPSSLRYVWRDEISSWLGLGKKTQLMNDKLDTPDLDATFLVLTYDQISTRTEVWKNPPGKLVDLLEENSGEEFFEYDDKKDQLNLCKPLPNPVRQTIEDVIDGKDLQRWKKIQSRLKNELLESIEKMGFDLLILDEAHRVKNYQANRTKSAKQLSQAAGWGVLALSGTPIQNNTREPATLLEVIDPLSFRIANHEEKITIDRLKGFLEKVMIRRLKEDVLKELPPLVEQVVPIGNGELREVGMGDYWSKIMEGSEGANTPEWAKEESSEIRTLARAWSSACFPPFVKWQEELGCRKAAHPDVLDFIKDILEEKECCVIFTEHHDVSETIFDVLAKQKISSKIVDGRNTPEERHRIVKEFNEEKSTQCLIAGMESVGEGFTIIRPDTCVFLQIFKKPSTMQQARERLHRIGQKAGTVTAYYLISENLMDQFFVKLNVAKGGLISTVLEENVKIVGESIDQSKNKSNETGNDENNATISSENVDKKDERNVTNPEVQKRRAQGAARAKRFRERHKNDEKADKMREQTRERVRLHREKHGEEYKKKHREYLREWRKRKKG